MTIDSLRRLAAEQKVQPTYHGLGLIRLKFSSLRIPTAPDKRDRAYHFYSAATAPIFDPAHDHLFTFTSAVIKGTLRNYVYEYDVVDYETDYSLCQRDYETREHVSVVYPNIEKRESCVYDTPAGSEYSMHYRTLHHVVPMTDSVVTLLTKEPPVQDVFNYIQDKKVEYSEPKIESKTANECWDIIEDILNSE